MKKYGHVCSGGRSCTIVVQWPGLFVHQATVEDLRRIGKTGSKQQEKADVDDKSGGSCE